MSSTLTAEPARRKKIDLPYELKIVLRKRFGEPIYVVVAEPTLPYLQGLVDADIKGALELMELIEKHNEIMLHEEY